MAKKFSMSSIAGLNLSESIEEGLLNMASQAKAVTMSRTEYIPVDIIRTNPKNKRSMNDIEELAGLIKAGGMDQSLVVRQLEDGTYMLLTGHRRFAAIQLLIERGQWNDEKLVEVKIKNLDDIDLPLDDELKEQYARLQTNRHRRDTDADIANDIREWREIITALREKGIELLVVGVDDDNQKEYNIKGVKTKDIVAELVGESTPQVSKYIRVENKGSDLLKEVLLDNKVNISVADKISNFPKEEQDNIISHVLEQKNEGDTITQDDVRVAQRELNMHKKTPKKKTVLTKEIFMNDIKDILSSLSDSKEIALSETGYATYLRGIENLKKTMCK